MNDSKLSAFLWSVADLLRGDYKQSDYGMGALDAHNAMSTQALNSETVQQGLKDVLLNNAGLYESLRKGPED